MRVSISLLVILLLFTLTTCNNETEEIKNNPLFADSGCRVASIIWYSSDGSGGVHYITKIEYNDQKRVIAILNEFDSNDFEKEEFVYDNNESVVEKWANSTMDENHMIEQYEYDAEERLSKVTSFLGWSGEDREEVWVMNNYNYFADSTVIIYEGGWCPECGGRTVYANFDELGRPSKSISYDVQVGVIGSATYEYDSKGNLSVHDYWDIFGGSCKISYEYYYEYLNLEIDPTPGLIPKNVNATHISTYTGCRSDGIATWEYRYGRNLGELIQEYLTSDFNRTGPVETYLYSEYLYICD